MYFYNKLFQSIDHFYLRFYALTFHSKWVWLKEVEYEMYFHIPVGFSNIWGYIYLLLIRGIFFLFFSMLLGSLDVVENSVWLFIFGYTLFLPSAHVLTNVHSQLSNLEAFLRKNSLNLLLHFMIFGTVKKHQIGTASLLLSKTMWDQIIIMIFHCAV